LITHPTRWASSAFCPPTPAVAASALHIPVVCRLVTAAAA
jgi:hypothetical protein